MELIKGPHPWSCTGAAFAMCFDISWDRMVRMVGHDGSEPNFYGDEDSRGFALQEMVLVGLQLGYAVINIELHPRITNKVGGVEKFITLQGLDDIKRMKSLMANRGVLGYGNHAVAWDGEKVYDPRGYITADFKIPQIFFLISKLENQIIL